ncbi:membrane protein [Clostridium sediminicola]|uniref:YczE/YyaS/YitT family protein n=1 Tax=Clostridium sediminicola TaxID=3114879 RepID=UPI0031F211BC
MKKILMIIIRLIPTLFLLAMGIVMTINANLGLSPWDVFHQGLSKNLDITMGQAGIVAGIVIIVLNYVLGERIGWCTIAGIVVTGIFIDILMLNNLIPIFNNVILQVIMMIIGMVAIGFATFIYLCEGLGSGPRDGLMVALTKKTGKSVRLIRNSIEITVLVVGFFLGGKVGIGTVIMAVLIGPIIQFVFKIMKFDVSKVKHRFIDQDIKWLKEKINHRKSLSSKLSRKR